MKQGGNKENCYINPESFHTFNSELSHFPSICLGRQKADKPNRRISEELKNSHDMDTPGLREQKIVWLHE